MTVYLNFDVFIVTSPTCFPECPPNVCNSIIGDAVNSVDVESPSRVACVQSLKIDTYAVAVACPRCTGRV